MKKGILLTLLVTLFVYMSASNQTAIDYYLSGDIKTAKERFSQTEKLDALDNYYLGLISIKENELEKAKTYFDAGLAIDPENVYNKIGLATLNMQKNQKATDKLLKKLWKTDKRNVNLGVAVAEAYLLNHNAKKADYYISKAIKYNKKSAEPYILEGVYLENENKQNDAAVKYENALYFNPNSKIALVKLAQLYVRTQKRIAFEYLQKATTIDPNYEYAWKTQARLRYKNGFYPQAKVAQEKYMALITPTPDDYQTYAEILYFNDDYKGTKENLKKSPVNTVTNRLNMYTYYKEDNYDKAINYATALFEITPKEKVITQDYKYYADMLYKGKKYSEAGQAYENAYNTDTTDNDLLKVASGAFKKGKNYPKAIELYEKMLNKKSAKTMADYYSLGGMYTKASKDTIFSPTQEIRFGYLKKADETYGKMTELFPSHYLGYLLRARANSLLDPETTEGLGKPYYEKAIEVMLPEADKRQNELKEAYQYMVIHYLKTDNYPESRAYCEKVLEIDPNNGLAKKVIKSIDGAKK